jgi:hypothetical protein
VAEHWTMIKDKTQHVGENTNHGQQDQSAGLMDGRVLEMGLGGKGLEHFRIDPPAAAAEFRDEAGRDQAQLQGVAQKFVLA